MPSVDSASASRTRRRITPFCHPSTLPLSDFQRGGGSMIFLRKAAGRAALVGVITAVAGVAGASGAAASRGGDQLRKIDHIVVIYEENHSFDNLYGRWEGVNGLANADAAHTTQVDEAGAPHGGLLQDDVKLKSPPPPGNRTDPAHGIASDFTNTWFTIDDFIPASARTCPPPLMAFSFPNGVLDPNGLPGGCTRDLVHRFYQEQYQLNDGNQNRYVTGSDAVGLTIVTYVTRALPIYRYLHRSGHPDYAIADNFFQAAFGGSFLNHQWLIAASNPVWPGAVNDGGANDLHSVVDENGMPNNYPLYTSPLDGAVKDQPLTASCSPPTGVPAPPKGVLCGDYAVNTIQPPYQPYAPGTAESRRLPPQTAPTIGDRLSGAGVDWAWYAGGWSNANGDVGGPGWTNGTTPGT